MGVESCGHGCEESVGLRILSSGPIQKAKMREYGQFLYKHVHFFGPAFDQALQGMPRFIRCSSVGTASILRAPTPVKPSGAFATKFRYRSIR